jgi:hypothetical protein
MRLVGKQRRTSVSPSKSDGVGRRGVNVSALLVGSSWRSITDGVFDGRMKLESSVDDSVLLSTFERALATGEEACSEKPGVR